MKLAIIGSGISGLVCAWLLHQEHDVTVFEANDYVGGHTHTLPVAAGGETFAVDTGFIVYNDWTYPNFIRLLDRLDVETQAASMSFSVSCERTGLEYNGSSLGGLFAQRHNLLRPGFYRFLGEIVRFNRAAPRVLSDPAETVTIGEFVRQHGFSAQFVNQYLFPMGAAIWSCPPGKFAEFPMRFVAEFYRNHGLLNLLDRPTWRVVRGGSWKYVDKLVSGFRDRIRLNSPVARVARTPQGVRIIAGHTASDTPGDVFDEAIFACHSDQALAMLAAPHDAEREMLSMFPYEENIALLHTDERMLPRSKRAWASWNYHIPAAETGKATLTYWMNLLQGLTASQQFCVTLNGEKQIDPARILARMVYHHPVYTVRRAEAQRRHSELIRRERLSYCGAYWGSGFHEDGVNSALAVCAAFGKGF